MALVATVTIQAAQVPSDLTDFVAYIDLAGMPAGFWSTVANGGGDIRCYKADGTTELAREVVSCDTATDTGELHVKFAGVLSSSSNTEIQIHTDGTSTEPAVTATFGRNAVWSDKALHAHFNGDLTDSTGNNTLLSAGAVAATFANGKAALPDSCSLRVAAEDAVNFDTLGGYKLSFWADFPSPNSPDVWMWIIGQDDNRRFDIQRVNDTLDLRLSSNLSTAAQITGALGLFFGQGFQKYDFIVTDSVFSLYINGSLVSSESHASPIQSTVTNEIEFFGRPDFNRDFWLDSLDELSFDNAVRSADWIATEYANQNSPATFYSIAANDAGGVDNVTPTGITTTPTLGTPSVGQVHALSATGITSSVTLGLPTAGSTANTDSVSPVGIVSSVTLGLSSVGQTHVLTTTGVVSTPSLGTPTASAVSFVTLTTLAAGASITVYKSANGWFDI